MSNTSDNPSQTTAIGPFTKETFNQAKWKHNRERIYLLNSTNEEETIPEVQFFLQFLLELNACDDYNKYFGETSIKNYFFDDLLPSNAKNLIGCKFFNNANLLELSNSCFEQMIVFWLKALPEDHPKLADMAKTILDPTRTYYKFNNQENLSSSVVPGFLEEATPEHITWIETIKEGDLIDCIKIDQTYKKMVWSHAKVTYVMESYLKVFFLNDHEKTSRYIDKKANIHEIAPYKQNCNDFDWRLSLKTGDLIDACDTSHIWYNATILNTRETALEDGSTVKELFIGYRIYHEDGDRLDSDGNRFSGWSAKYDEWLSATDARITKKGTMAKKLFLGSSSNTEDPVVDDSNDRIYNPDGRRIYAIIRSGYCKSTFLIKLVNKFGQMGGFDMIYDRITNPNNWAPIETVSLLSNILGNLATILHRDFAFEYIPKLKEAVWKNLLSSPDSNIRNFTKDKIEYIVTAFDSLLKRVYSLPEKQEMVESLNIQICCICFDSQFLERKLQGLKTLLQIIKEMKYNSSSQKFMTNSLLNTFLFKNEIFSKIFGSKGHVQLIQRSAEFLKYMLHEDILGSEDFQNIWAGSTKGDMETKLAVYKVISDVSLHLKGIHLDFLITKISEIPPQDVIAEEIDLVFEMCKFSIKPAWFIKKARHFYWTIISDETGGYSQAIVDQTLSKFCDIMKGSDFREDRIIVLYDCLENIRKRTSVLSSLKIMKKLIEHYPVSPASSEKFTKSSCIEHLCKEKGLLEALIEDLKGFKEVLKNKTENLKTITEEDLNAVASEKATYLTHITERLQFIHYLLANNSAGEIKLTYELLSELWDVIVNNALIPSERDVVYKWIKEIAESKSGFPMSIDDLRKFFTEMMSTNPNQESQRMTKEGFKCFKNVFLVINEKLTKISKVNVNASSTSSYTSIYGGYPYMSNRQNDEKKKERNFGYKINVFPNELEGINSIWDFILVAEEGKVADKAIDFLNKLYLHVSNELEAQITTIRDEYLHTCNVHLKETIKNQSKYSETAFTNRCLRCLKLISSVMDESEKLGIGNLKSHSGLVKGELISLTIINDVSGGADVPKKAEIRMHSNTTIFGLRVEIAKQFKATWDQVKLVRRPDSKEIKDNENGRTIREIRLKNGEVLTASKRPTPPIPQVNLIQGDDTLHPTAKKIFIEWFEIHAQNGRMNPEQCAAFIHSCTNDHCKAEDKRVKDVFALHDDDRDGFLTLENFLKFYSSACKQRPSVVWSNLHSHHYRNDLKKVTEVEQEKVDITKLPRYLISANDEYFELIFSLLDFGGKIAIETWKLLNRLPTSPHMFAEIVLLKGVREATDPAKRDWNHILDLESKYKLLYALHIIEYLMEDDEAETEEEDEGEKQTSQLLWARDPKLQEYKKTWQADFIIYGGFVHLFKIFNIYADKNSKKLNVFDKNILSFVLKILKNYLSATFAATVPGMYRNLSFIRLFYLSLDFIQDYINSEHTRLSRENSFKISQDGAPELTEAAKKEGTKPKNDAEGAKLPRKDSKAEEKKKEKLKIEETEEFSALVDRLRGELGSQILSTLNLKDLLEVISNLGFNTLTDSGDLEPEDRMILEYSLTILMAILFFDENNIKYFLNPEKDPQGHKDADKYMLEGIFFSRSVNIRKYFSHAIYVLCKHTQRFQNSFASKYFISLLLNYLPSSAEDSKKDCNQYFELLCKLIEETYMDKGPRSSQAVDEEPLDFKDLLQKVIERLRSHVSTERRNNLNVTDKVMMGLLNLCEKIVTVQPQLRDSLSEGETNLVEEIFNVCLFNVQESIEGALVPKDQGSKEYVKCKSKDSRAYAYKLLIALCRDHEKNMLTLLESMKNLTKKILQVNTKTGWGYSPSSDTKSMYGYVGIKNLGCICYMNAMLQQFFMTPTFRYAILAADDKIEPNWVKKDKLTIDDNVLHQLQKMFGFLELSDRQDYNPQEFCFAFKDHAGQPVNVSIQQDTQEFLNMIFDKLEQGLKQTPFQHILESVYGGKTSNQVICHGCGYMREREDIFYNLSVEVKNLKTIYESFEKFITGETIEDYYCENCKKKNAITKRTCLSELPNVLIVHLQRIVFDLDTFMNQKINTKLEFPTQLNLEPYTKEGLEWREKSKQQKLNGQKKGDDTESGSLKMSNKGQSETTDKKEDDETDIYEDDEEEFEVVGENEKDASGKKSRKPKKKEEADEILGPYMKHDKEHYEYKLAGVVVHVGTADFGHYYSYISTNREDLRGEGAKKTDRWLEYNDSMIKDFDTKDIENECFGGAGSDSSDDYWSFGKSSREYSKNAYILVYERVVKDPLKLVVRNEEDKSYLNKILKLDQVSSEKQEVRVEKVEVGEGENKQTIENYYCDYFKLGKSILPRVDQAVWEDNHKFMFERHIYTEDFFKFVKEICSTFKIPDEILSQQPVNFIYPKHNLLSLQVKQSMLSLIKILAELVFYLLARAYDNNTITELSEKLKMFLSLNPEAAWPLFSQIAANDYKNVLELFLNCPEKQVRSCTSQLLLHTINVIISHHGLTLNSPVKKNDEANQSEREDNIEKIEEAIVSFLGMLRAHMPTEVAKNWLKFQQFFEFWRDFATSGEVQMKYLFQHEFISVLIDFYLEKKSPVPELSEKKHSMGNRYTDPEFNPLIQTIACMVVRSHVVTKSGAPPLSSHARQGYPAFNLSSNDLKCLTCPEFYEKTLKEKYNFVCLGTIIQHFCFENESFSYCIAEILLKGINRCNYEEVKPYLEAMSYFVSIADFLQPKRLEWIFGYPQPIVSTARSGADNFGTFGNSSIEELVVSYETPLALENTTSILNLILQGRKKFDNLCMVCIRQIIMLLNENNTIFQYITSLPPPSYNYAKFTDWITPFIDYFLADAKRFSYSSYSQEEVGLEAQKIWKSIEAKLQETVENTNKAWEQAYSTFQDGINTNQQEEKVEEKEEKEEGENKEASEKKDEVLSWIIKPYIIGQTYKEEELDRKYYTNQDIPQEVSLASVESYCYITESKPTGKGNKAFPDFIMNDQKYRTVDVNTESPLSLFIQPRGVSEAGQLTMKSYVEKALKDKNPEEKNTIAKEDSSDGEVIEPLLQDDDDIKERQKLNEEKNINGVTKVEGSSGDAEQLDKSPASEESNKLAENTENTDPSKSKESNEQEKPKENANEPNGLVERNGYVELERVVASPEDFTFNYELNPVVRRFIFYNPTPYTVVVQTRIIPKTGDFMNFRVPVSTFKSKVKAHGNTCVLGLIKLLPEVGWGEYEVECEIQKVDSVGSKSDDSGKKKNVHFHIRVLNLNNGNAKEDEEKERMAAEDYYAKV